MYFYQRIVLTQHYRRSHQEEIIGQVRVATAQNRTGYLLLIRRQRPRSPSHHNTHDTGTSFFIINEPENKPLHKQIYGRERYKADGSPRPARSARDSFNFYRHRRVVLTYPQIHTQATAIDLHVSKVHALGTRLIGTASMVRVRPAHALRVTTPYGVIAVGRIFVSAKVVHENVYGECARRKAHVQGRRCAPIRGIFGDELG
ncbi:hypothetical protein EVAR_89214_1 [Eumeta japonica]|uniref:Uncharacterized protein n=1 Tax=Eumeta variegata TaxID=151549 RepID=A0A4C2AB50_EUMVA|nr:hypothetical protein EVAR_89214_1 [Eumeta japonica]